MIAGIANYFLSHAACFNKKNQKPNIATLYSQQTSSIQLEFANSQQQLKTCKNNLILHISEEVSEHSQISMLTANECMVPYVINCHLYLLYYSQDTIASYLSLSILYVIYASWFEVLSSDKFLIISFLTISLASSPPKNFQNVFLCKSPEFLRSLSDILADS